MRPRTNGSWDTPADTQQRAPPPGHPPPRPPPPRRVPRFLDDGSGQRVRVEGSRGARWQQDALETRQDYREKPEGAGLQSLAQFFT